VGRGPSPVGSCRDHGEGGLLFAAQPTATSPRTQSGCPLSSLTLPPASLAPKWEPRLASHPQKALASATRRRCAGRLCIWPPSTRGRGLSQRARPIVPHLSQQKRCQSRPAPPLVRPHPRAPCLSAQRRPPARRSPADRSQRWPTRYHPCSRE